MNICPHDQQQKIKAFLFLPKPNPDCVSVNGFRLRKYFQVLELMETYGFTKEKAKEIINLIY